MADLSVLIPARNERWLSRTVEDVCSHIKGDTEVIVVLDGAWPDPSYELIQHSNVNIIFLPESIGQRAAVNLAAKVSTAKYIMKLDAHCAVADGFDVELMRTAEQLGHDVTQIPAQHNLHIFDWVCKTCGYREYQGPTPVECRQCSSKLIAQEVVWKAQRRRTEYWRFDSDLHFQYWGGYGERPEAKAEIVDVMTSLGACFFMERSRFWDLDGLDEAHGSWGQFGVEIACKSWLSGGRHVVNKRTWFSHLFRTQGGDFSFPYKIHSTSQEEARQYSRRLWKTNGWSGQQLPLKWLLEKFWPVPGWSEEQLAALPLRTIIALDEDLEVSHSIAEKDVDIVSYSVGAEDRTTGIVYYSDDRIDLDIQDVVQQQIRHAAGDASIAAVTLKRVWPQPNGVVIVLEAERGYLTMFQQILAGLEALDTDYVFLCEHDVLYHPSHFDFVPPRDDVYYYNQNVWKVDAKTGKALHYLCSQTSGLCANRQLLLDHYRKRVATVAAKGYSRSMGFEPGTHNRAERIDDFKAETWMSAQPNIDIRHDKNLTPSRWRREQFRNQRYTEGWTEAANVPGWPRLEGRPFSEFLQEVASAFQQAIA